MISDMNNYDLGKTVAHYRKLRGLTQVEFGKLLSRSTSWVKKFEAGERQANPQIGIVEHISQVLGITPEKLLKTSPESPYLLLRSHPSQNLPINTHIKKIEQVMLTPTSYLNKGGNYSFDKVHQSIEYAFTSYQASRYLSVCELVPDLLTELYTLPPRRENLQLAAVLYRLICVIFMKSGVTKLGMIAAERAMNAALEYDDPHEIALATWAMVYALSLDDKADLALDFGEKTLTLVSDHLNHAGVRGGAALGFLLMRCSFASSILGEKQEAIKFLDRAKPHGDKVGKTNYFHSDFGHANIKLHEFLVYANLGMHGKAFEYETFIDTMEFAEMTKTRRCHFLVDLAHVHWKEAHYEKSAQLLIRTAQLSDQELIIRKEARDLLYSLRHDISKKHFSPNTAKALEELQV